MACTRFRCYDGAAFSRSWSVASVRSLSGHLQLVGRSLLIGAVALLIAAGPSGARGADLDLGGAGDPLAAPSCPPQAPASQCFIILTRTTALQSRTAGTNDPTRVERAGLIVSFSIGLSDLSAAASTRRAYIRTLDQAYGGPPEVRLTALRPRGGQRFSVAAQSSVIKVEPRLGTVATYPVSEPIRVSVGERLALTVPTWAPVLTYGLAIGQFSYRQSRASNCQNPPARQTAQNSVGATASYGCAYTGTRVQYTAREVLGGSPLSPFKVAAVIRTQSGHPDDVTLLRLLLQGVSRSATASGGVLTPDSRRRGNINLASQLGNRRTYVARPPLELDGRSRIILGVSRPGRIGRFKLYRVEPAARSLVIVAQGCTSPGVEVNIEQAANPRKVPRVPCA